MASISINVKSQNLLKSVSSKSNYLKRVDQTKKTLKATGKLAFEARSVIHKRYPIFKLDGLSNNASFENTVPFYVRFTNITVPGYGPSNVPGIGVQVIGYSNYIL